MYNKKVNIVFKIFCFRNVCLCVCTESQGKICLTENNLKKDWKLLHYTYQPFRQEQTITSVFFYEKTEAKKGEVNCLWSPRNHM